uniref:Uncharacterized protein n=1 Tax=Ditylenchus dipsaci TaxID=166011 RepID=A0A915DG04_9BILA
MTRTKICAAKIVAGVKNCLPGEETELQEEIRKQKSLLDYVQTKDDDQAISSTLREQEIWQVQEAIKILTSELKSLQAIQSSLKDEITAEKRNIVQLLTRLREIHSQLPQEAIQKLNRHRLSQQVEINPANGFSSTDEHTSKENDQKKN